MEPEYSILCTTWTHWIGASIEEPWGQYLIKIPDGDLVQLSVGTYIESFTSTPSPVSGDNPPLKVGALIYKDNISDDIYTVDGPGRTLVGILITDSDGNILTINSDAFDYEGDICFYILSNSDEVQSILCYKKLVWKLQKNFSMCVEKYLNQLNFGTVCCSMLEDLKMKKRVLEVLNQYDVRDIPDDTTDYNKMTYTKIKSIASLIKTC